MPKRDLLKLPDDLEGNLRALLHTPPPPAGTPGSRKVEPKPKPKAKAKMKQRRRVPRASTGTYEYEYAPVLKAGKKAKKAAKKR